MNSIVSCIVEVDIIRNFGSSAFSTLQKAFRVFVYRILVSKSFSQIQITLTPPTHFCSLQEKTLFPETMGTMLGG